MSPPMKYKYLLLIAVVFQQNSALFYHYMKYIRELRTNKIIEPLHKH